MKTKMDGSFVIVLLSAFLVLAFTVLQYFVSPEHADLLDQDMVAWIFAAVATAYVGLDRAAQVNVSSKLPFGQVDSGKTGKLTAVIAITLILILAVIIATIVFDVYGLSTQPLLTGLGGTCGSSVAGNKAIKVVSANEGSHSTAELDQTTIEL